MADQDRLPGIPATITGPQQGPGPGQVSVAEFAASLKKAMPDLAQFPDQAVVDRYLVAYPQFKSKVAQPAPETFLQKTWPTGATIGPPEKLGTMAAIRQVVEDARNKLSTRLFGTQPEGGAGEILASPALGALRLARGAIDLPRAAMGEGPGWWSGTKDIGLGALQTATLPLAFQGPESMAAKGKFTPPEAAATARKLTDIINPAAKEMPEFETTLTKHLDKVITYAQRAGLKISNPDELIAAIRQTGDALKGHFDARILNPVRDVQVPISSIRGYAGKGAAGASGEGATATLGDLYDRLTQIHAELYPKFARGGEAAEKGVKSASDLKSEADAIRHVFYDELSKATGIPRDQLASIREAFGELNTAADRGQQALSSTRHAANLQAKTTPKPLRTVIGQAITRRSPAAVEARQAREVEKAVQGLSRYGAEYEPPPAYTPQTRTGAARFPRPQPLGSEGVQTAVEGTTAAEREARLQQLARRGQAVRAAKAAKAARVGAARLTPLRDIGEGTTIGTEGTTEAERAAQAEKVAKRAAEVKAARAARLRKIAEARAARRRPPEE